MMRLLRILSILLLVLTVCLVALDSQTKVLYLSISKKATYRDLKALYHLVWIDGAAAVYNFLQLLIECSMSPGSNKDRADPASYIYRAWGFYLLDQVAVYLVFGAQSAATAASVLAITGQSSFQWMKLCDKYTRLCIQIGGALGCGFVATFVMVIIASKSAYALFRHYTPHRFMRLKSK